MAPELIHIDFIKRVLDEPLRTKGVLYVGNNLNNFFDFDVAEGYANEHKKHGTDRQQKSSKDVFTGTLAEEVLVYLLHNFFEHNRMNYEIAIGRRSHSFIGQFKIVNERLGHEKRFDVDIFIRKKGVDNKVFLISCKGTSRERIGQFISNLFLMDDRLVDMKYSGRYFLEFKRKGIDIQYGFVCYDWARNKDFVKHNASGGLRRTLKQTEIFLINDDYYIGGGVTILNNLKNLDGTTNFAGLVGKIADFLN